MTTEDIAVLKRLLGALRRGLQNGDQLVAVSIEAKKMEEKP